ncbi:MAG: CDP-alcohol phosphatidyltransferase family protein [Clostridia bacterium]|nr:CDP-alcohol phosphatidyltransferase family protein [Clostridia bacterium]MDR3643996.1 CDP-alcohol phosphatidyltransferase family protein [Clostridia bacterium]
MEGKYARFEKLSLPNLLSVFRIILIPVFVTAFFSPFSRHSMIAAAILVLSGITDVLDGYIARRFEMVTDLGKLLDPFADKLTQAAVCVCLVVDCPSLFFLLLLFIVKEVLMIVGGAKMVRRGIDFGSSRWFGKLSTCVFYVVMVAIIAFEIKGAAAVVLILISLGFMVFSFVMYLRIFRSLVNKNMK